MVLGWHLHQSALHKSAPLSLRVQLLRVGVPRLENMLSGKTTASQTIDIIAVELKRPNGKLESEIQKCLVCPKTSANGLEATGARRRSANSRQDPFRRLI
jgi:hypothetical protein